MLRILLIVILTAAHVAEGQSETRTEGKTAGKSGHGKPAEIAVVELEGFAALAADRRKLIELAIAVRHDNPWLPYLFGGSTPAAGGFDCSGAIYFVLRGAGLTPPRTSAGQYLWLRDEGRIHLVSEAAKNPDHTSLKHLLPGDLLFWSGTYLPEDGREIKITHVAIYLGQEKKDDHHVMINSTDGRSYRGTKANGYGVYDFRLPLATGRSRLVGYGTPPGIVK